MRSGILTMLRLSGSSRARRVPAMFAALQHRNFRLLWLGQLVSFSGSMMQQAAILWHVSLLVPPGRRGLALGIVGLVRVGPIVAFSLLSGVAADALDRRRLMMVTQLSAALVAVTLAALAFGGLSVVWPVYVLAGLGAAAGAFDGPARQALIPNLVPREHLANALSLNQIMFQSASVVGPSLGGVLIATLGVGWAYLFNAVSFLFVLVALFRMRDVPVVATNERAAASLGAAREGLRFVFSSPIIRATMLLDFAATFFASATALLPIFAQDVLHVGANGYGWLYAAPSIGSLLAGGIMIRVVDRIEQRGVVLLWAIVVYGLATLAFGLSKIFWLTFFCLALTGAADAVSTVLRSIIRQLMTPDRLRGRVTSVNMIFFMGGPQLGELEAGLVANWRGAPFSVVTGGFGTLIATAAVAAGVPALRRYRRTGESQLAETAKEQAIGESGAGARELGETAN
jgi:MFS family permease